MKLVSLVVLGVLATSCASTQSLLVETATKKPYFTARYVETPGDSMEQAFIDLSGRLEAGGITIEEEDDLVNPDNGQPVYGLTFRPLFLIKLRKNMSVNAKFETLCHEGAHMFQGGYLDYSVAEVFAEIVGARVQNFYGSKTWQTTSSEYLAGFKSGFPSLRYMKVDMDMAYKALIGKIPWKLTTNEQ